MEENLKDFMSEEEKQQVDAILGKAGERMRAAQVSRQEQQFLFLGCQCECYQEMTRQKQKGQEKVDFEEDIQQLLQQICEFCKRHRACFRREEGKKEREGEDDELPF